MKTVQVPILLGVVGLIAAAAFVVAPLADDNGATSPGITVGETTAPAPADPTASNEDGVLIQNDDGTVTRRDAEDAPTSSASLEEKPVPRPAGDGGTGGDTSGGTGGGTGGGGGDVCEWDDGEWECDDEYDDDEYDDDDDDEDDHDNDD